MTLADRRRLYHLVERKVPINEMARQLGRHRSTIYREIKRNTFRDHELPDYDGYYSTVADDIAKERRRRLRKLTGLAIIDICLRRAANAVRGASDSRETACFLPVTGYRNILILLAIDLNLVTGRATF
ncbi:hypothetical protein GGQ99_005131 [Aminobacter niigataensis]|uniref:Transposase IS30-like HTH domain-containing protein n=1 Tax=Aminobacter niigataensis TaxID=83265 RepID=A0ABR6LBP7_9HYPH|nr:hypothetical protein [Aminobacter niigataensis]